MGLLPGSKLPLMPSLRVHPRLDDGLQFRRRQVLHLQPPRKPQVRPAVLGLFLDELLHLGGTLESREERVGSAQSLKLVNDPSDDPVLISCRRTLIALLETAKRLAVVSKGTFLSRSPNTSDLGKDRNGH